MVLRSLTTCLALAALVACDSSLPQLDLEGSALGTSFVVSLVEPADDLDAEQLRADVLLVLGTVDDLASTWRNDSELSTFNADLSIDWIPVSAEFCRLLERSQEVSAATGGAFDLTIGPLVNLWGFGPDGEVAEPPSSAHIEAAKRRVGFDKLEIDCAEQLVRKDEPDLYVDLSGWAKGYAVDQLAEMLDARDIEHFLVEVGGELRVKGRNRDGNKWAIGIEAPSTSARVPHAVINVTNTSGATSGDYRNFFDHDGQLFSHTIDARTGRPVMHNLAAVTVIDPSAAYADAMATALLVLGPDAGPKLANELHLAAYFLVRNQADIREITTTEFDTLSTP
jgi:thiamine biosynthesis lipoprotein